MSVINFCSCIFLVLLTSVIKNLTVASKGLWQTINKSVIKHCCAVRWSTRTDLVLSGGKRCQSSERTTRAFSSELFHVGGEPHTSGHSPVKHTLHLFRVSLSPHNNVSQPRLWAALLFKKVILQWKCNAQRHLKWPWAWPGVSGWPAVRYTREYTEQNARLEIPLRIILFAGLDHYCNLPAHPLVSDLQAVHKLLFCEKKLSTFWQKKSAYLDPVPRPQSTLGEKINK